MKKGILLLNMVMQPCLNHRGWKINFHTTYLQARLIQIRVATEALYFPSTLLVHMTHFPLFGGAGHQCIREKIRPMLSNCTSGAVIGIVVVGELYIRRSVRVTDLASYLPF